MNKGFTLIELLIVIAIIGILVATIAPRYVGFTQDAKEAATQSNLSAIRGALSLYAGKNEGNYPANLSNLVATYIQEIPYNKLTDQNNAASDCTDTNTGWGYDGNGTVRACCADTVPDGCPGAPGNATW